MNPRLILISLSLSLPLAGFAHAAEPAPSSADQVLRQMSAKLAAARQFSFQAVRETDAALLPGRTEREKARLAVQVQRPDKFAVQSVSAGEVRHFFFDGRNVTVFDVTMNHYATVPARTSLDGLVENVGAKYGFTPPLAELVLSDVYADMRDQAQSITDLGPAWLPAGFLGLGDTPCRRVGLGGKAVEAELWIAESDGLPRKLIVAHKGTGQPRSTVEFSDWDLAAKTAPQSFTFVPPKGAAQIRMLSTAEVAAARRKAGRK